MARSCGRMAEPDPFAAGFGVSGRLPGSRGVRGHGESVFFEVSVFLPGGELRKLGKRKKEK